MFHGPLACVRSFLCSDGIGNVTLEVDVLLFRLVGQGEVGFTRDARVNLDEIGATGFDSAGAL